MKITSISELQVNLNKLVFTPGDQITGSVSLKVVEPIKIQGFKLNLVGEALALWAWNKDAPDNRRRYGSVEFFKDKPEFECVFVAEQNNGADSILQVGESNYPFQFTLPQNLPTSLEHRIRGYVRYTVMATIKSHKLYFAEMVITVINMLDLNSFPSTIRQPLGFSNNVEATGCCSKGMIEYNISVPKAGYVPGERIFFTIGINNQSGSKCSSVEVALLEYLTMKPLKLDQTKRVKRIMAELQMSPHDSVPAMTSDKWQGVLIVPAVACSMPESLCGIMAIDYSLSLSFKSGSSTNEAEVPITIGYVPIDGGGRSEFVYKPDETLAQFKPNDFRPGFDFVNMQSNFLPYTPVYPFYDSLS